MDKDIRYTEKKIDESWKEQADRDKGVADFAPRPAAAGETGAPKKASRPSEKPQTSKVFFSFINSLGYQAMIQLGEVANPETNAKEVNLDACRELIDLLSSLKEKTEGNWSQEEEYFFAKFLPELQMKFAEKVE